MGAPRRRCFRPRLTRVPGHRRTRPGRQNGICSLLFQPDLEVSELPSLEARPRAQDMRLRSSSTHAHPRLKHHSLREATDLDETQRSLATALLHLGNVARQSSGSALRSAARNLPKYGEMRVEARCVAPSQREGARPRAIHVSRRASWTRGEGGPSPWRRGMPCPGKRHVLPRGCALQPSCLPRPRPSTFPR